MKRKILQVLLFLGLSSTLNAQNFSYAWHEIQDAMDLEPITFKVYDDKIYTIYYSTLETDFDANPGTGVDMMTAGTGDILLYMTVTQTDGTYLESFKLIENSGFLFKESVLLSITNDGKLLVTGHTYAQGYVTNFNPEGSPVGLDATTDLVSFVAVYENDGTYIHHFEYGFSYGLIQEMYIKDMVVENDNLFLVGTYRGDIDFDPTNGSDVLTTSSSWNAHDGFVTKVNWTNSSYSWTKSIGANEDEYIHYIRLDNNKIVLNGSYSGNYLDLDPDDETTFPLNNSHDLIGQYRSHFLSIMDLNGNFLNGLGLSGNVSLGFGGLAVDASSNYYILGSASQGEYLDLDPSAGISWLYSSDNNNIFIVKYDQNLNLVWQNSIFATNQIYLSSYQTQRSLLENGGSHNAIVLEGFSGYLKQSQNFTTPVTVGTSSLMLNDAVVLAISSLNGEVSSIANINSNELYTTDIELTAEGDVILQGELIGDADFIFDDGIMNTTSAETGFCIRLDWSGYAGINENTSNVEIEAYPNPVTTNFVVTSNEVIQSLILSDMSGRRILANDDVFDNKITLDLTNQNSGCYFLTINTLNGESTTQKIIKD